MDNIWKNALDILEKEVNEQIFSAWFLQIKQLFADNQTLVLSVPNKFFENWVRDKYFSLINTAVNQTSGKTLVIEFKISENSVLTGGPPPIPEKDVSPTEEKEQSAGWLKSMFSGAKQAQDNRSKDIGLNPNYTFDTFVVGSSNRFAHAASLAVCERIAKVYNPLFLYGGVGLGKTHLMQAMGHEVLNKYPKAKVCYISSEEFTNQLIQAIRNRTTEKFRNKYRKVDILLIDDIQFIANKESTQEEFFHTFNSLHDAHKQIVLCSDRSPQDIKGLEKRLVSRFAWGLIADIQSPDFETRIAIIEKKSENEDIAISKEVLYFLAEHIKTNIREMEGALIRVVAYAKLTGEHITVDLAKTVLKGMIISDERKITIKQIQKIVADFFAIREEDMKTKKRTRAIAYPRQMAMYLSRSLTDHSLPDIGGFFGGRDHTTVLHACDKISKELLNNDQTKMTVEKLVSLIKR